MKTLSIDIETYSDVDLRKQGVYRYCDTPNFEILLIAYAFDNEPVEIIDLACKEKIPQSFLDALTNSTIVKKAYNANFERTCLSKALGIQLQPESWHCTAVHSAMLGLPSSLGEVAKLLKLAQQKDTAGTMLINYFAKPCKPTRANGGRTRNYPYHDKDKWALFKKYCIQDVETERAISKYLSKYPVTKFENEMYAIDQKINDFGIGVDTDLVESILSYINNHVDDVLAETKEITELDNPNSREQLLNWLRAQGLEIEDIRKDTLVSLLDTDIDDHIKLVISNRLESGMASVKKYQTLHDATCSDDRIRGTLQFYGANRTGRWAGRLVQVQNLSKNFMKELDAVRTLTKTGEWDTLECLYDSMNNIFSQLVRTSFVASEGYTYAISDYSGIEARVIAWLANERWAMDVFAQDGDIYKTTASQMFHIPIEEIDKKLRQKGKISVLALGYNGGVGALKAMGALNMGIAESELPGLVKQWRKANPNICKLWRDVDALAKAAIKSKSKVELHHGVYFKYNGDYLFIGLPSGRELAYVKPKIVETEMGTKIEYQGRESGKNVWGITDTFGGKLVENIVQAIARDCLAMAIYRIDRQTDYRISFHVHDEIIVEVKEETVEQDLEEVKRIMGLPIDWAEGLYLTAAGYHSKYYLKD